MAKELLNPGGAGGGHRLPGFLQGFPYGFPQPPPGQTDTLWSRQVVLAVGGELAGRKHPGGAGKQLLLRLVTCHKWGPAGIDTGPSTA